jgi:hypothetical protein
MMSDEVTNSWFQMMMYMRRYMKQVHNWSATPIWVPEITVQINLPTWVYPWPVLIGRPLLLVVFGRILLRIGKVSVLAWSFVFHSLFNIFSAFIKEITTIDKHWNHIKMYNFVSKQHPYNAPTKLSRIFSRNIKIWNLSSLNYKEITE